ncbi:MAG: hypothetical protein ACHQ7M_22705 [Chloroflexota bacterium]
MLKSLVVAAVMALASIATPTQAQEAPQPSCLQDVWTKNYLSNPEYTAQEQDKFPPTTPAEVDSSFAMRYYHSGEASKIKLGTAECYVGRHDEKDAAVWYAAVDPRTIEEAWSGDGPVQPPYLPQYHEFVALRGALAFWHTGDKAKALVWVREAKSVMDDNGRPSHEIKAAYAMIDAGRTQRAIEASLQADLRRIDAQHKAFASHYRGDMHDVGLENGRPCHVTTSDSSLGHLEIWYYDCVADTGIGREHYTFLDGRLTDHTQL